jgi:hypothetical protein
MKDGSENSKNQMPKAVFLLRKGRDEKRAVVVRVDDLPLQISFNNKLYQISPTKSGGLITTRI